MRWLFLLLAFVSVAVGRAQQAGTNAAPAAAPAAPSSEASAPAAPDAPVDPVKEAEIRKFIRNSGIKENMKVALDHVIEGYRAKHPTMPSDFWTQVESDSSMEDFISRLVPIYARFYSLDDLKAINAFSDGPVGRHMHEVQSDINGATKLAAHQWGKEMGAKIMSEVLAQEAKNYAQEDKKTYYTAVNTNGAPSPSAADASTNAAPATK